MIKFLFALVDMMKKIKLKIQTKNNLLCRPKGGPNENLHKFF